jgi:hypothetical protein
VKPDIVVPASRTIAPMPKQSSLAAEMERLAKQDKCKTSPGNPGPISGDIASYCWWENAQLDLKIGTPAQSHAYYQLSGTSMAAAEVSGIVALILQANPSLTNDQVKARLMDTARFALDPSSGLPGYSVWEQGAGLVNAVAAVDQISPAAANVGMDIALDLQVFTDGRDEVHYWGTTVWDERSREFRLIDPDTGQLLQSWAGGYKAWAGGYKAWAGGYKAWAGGYKAWAGGYKAWAGSNRPWESKASSPAAADVASTGVILDDPLYLYTQYLPALTR